MPYYIDSSALIKLVIEESASDSMNSWYMEFRWNTVSSELARTEVLRSVRRRAPDLLTRAENVLDTTWLLRLNPGMFDEAGKLDPVSLRSLDALHLVCALSLDTALEGFVTYDSRLAEAAEFHGIPVVAPGT